MTIGEQRHTVTADRSGLIDEVVPISLSPCFPSACRPRIRSPADDRPATEWRLRSTWSTRIARARNRLRRRRHGDGHRIAPADVGQAWMRVVLNEHSRRPTPRMPVFYERLTRAYRDATSGLSADRCLERRAHSDPFPWLAPCIPPAPCYSPIGGRPRPAGSVVAATTRARVWSGWPRSSRM